MKLYSFLMKSFRQISENSLLFFFCFILITGCVSTGKPQAPVENYIVDYPTPIFAKLPVIDDTIRVSRFTIATAYNNTGMITRQDNYYLDSFNYNRWAVNPADMVGDNFLRDLQASGYFRAALSRYAVDEGKYIVQGGIYEFYMRKDQGNNIAVLSLEITLKDIKQRDAVRRILFQKKYSREEALADQSPRGYCQAMSRALQKLSPEIIHDIYRAIKPVENK
jgi:ABC-type uncharacterized transport system auxiliary subunit